MHRTYSTRQFVLILFIMMMPILVSCGNKGQERQGSRSRPIEKQHNVKIILDWTPNTNHTGLYVAREKGFYKEQGLHVEIIQPNTGTLDAIVASGEVQFGISSQEAITIARSQNMPIVSIGAIIQHNTSGFAAKKDKNIKSPKDFEGKIFGSWGSPFEEMLLRTLMEKDGGDYNKLKSVNIGNVDYFTALKRDIDFVWIFYGWTGIEAELRNEPLDILYINQYADELNFYTPVIATNEKLIREDPELIRAFMRATAKGYQYAIDDAAGAANILLKAVPDLNKQLVRKSQEWLSPRYKRDAPRWGEQKPKVWEDFAKLLMENKLIEKPIDSNKAFTNEFLPAS